MRKSNTKLSGILQSTTLSQDSYDFIKGVDINFLGNEGGFILEDTEALKNKILFWLTSARGDYVRQPSKGGPLYGVIGKAITPNNIANIQASLSSGFQDMFGKELRLISLYINMDKSSQPGKAGIIVNMVIKDLLSYDLFRVAAGVEL